ISYRGWFARNTARRSPCRRKAAARAISPSRAASAGAARAPQKKLKPPSPAASEAKRETQTKPSKKRRQFRRYLSEVPILVKVLLSEVPTVLTAARITIEMLPAIKAYSIAVAPDSSLQNAKSLDMWHSGQLFTGET